MNLLLLVNATNLSQEGTTVESLRKKCEEVLLADSQQVQLFSLRLLSDSKEVVTGQVACRITNSSESCVCLGFAHFLIRAVCNQI